MAGIDDMLSTSGALSAFGSELKGATNSVVGLAGNLLSGSMKLSDYSTVSYTHLRAHETQ